MQLLCWGIYLWVLPASSLGLILALPLLIMGGKCQRHTGVLEIEAPAFCARWARGFGAITFGHIVIARDALQMNCLRGHERVHVRQYERWGILFFPLYLISSIWQLMRGRRFYRDNYFERQAYDQQALYQDKSTF